MSNNNRGTMQIAGYKGQLSRKKFHIRHLESQEASLRSEISKLQSIIRQIPPPEKDYTNCIDKQLLRERVAKRAQGLSGVCISLTGTDPITEKEIYKNNKKLRFIALEQDLDRHQKLSHTVKAEKLNYISVAPAGEIGEYVRKNFKKKDSLSLALLDYCCTFPKCYDDIKHIISNNIVKKGGAIAMTINVRTKGGELETRRCIRELLDNNGTSVYRNEYFTTYRDTSAMYFCIIGRIK